MQNKMNMLARIAEKQDRAAMLREELERSMLAKQVMPELFAKGKFTLVVTGRQTPPCARLGLRNLPYKAHVKYEKSGLKVELTYEQWAVLSRQYYSPDHHQHIQRYWNSEGT